ncbi:hypothetical protein ALC53_06068 [Atta colombica]|uniref:Uncharacterized protein n=1 Tax=Atta colombica TaxID=520822 RepID=A0A195BGQ6_9HYME|nr:hypothetical protein ALC53_06068 [Atta colombica]
MAQAPLSEATTTPVSEGTTVKSQWDLDAPDHSIMSNSLTISQPFVCFPIRGRVPTRPTCACQKGRRGLVDDAAAVTAGVSHQNDAMSAIRFNAKLNYAETDRNTRPHCFTTDQQSHVNITYLSGTTKEEEMGISSVTEGTTVVLGAKTRTGSDPGGGIDLLAALQLHNTTRQGVTQVPGLVRLRPAYYLQVNDKQQCLLMDACASHYMTLVMQRAINRYCERSV